MSGEGAPVYHSWTKQRPDPAFVVAGVGTALNHVVCTLCVSRFFFEGRSPPLFIAHRQSQKNHRKSKEKSARRERWSCTKSIIILGGLHPVRLELRMQLAIIVRVADYLCSFWKDSDGLGEYPPLPLSESLHIGYWGPSPVTSPFHRPRSPPPRLPRVGKSASSFELQRSHTGRTSRKCQSQSLAGR
jgi:hypothetical protein